MSAGTLLAWAGGVVAAFLVGSLNPATMIARLLGKDLASSGSGNPGATNAGRDLTSRALSSSFLAFGISVLSIASITCW